MIEPDLEKGMCPICKKVNIINPNNEISDLFGDFITVQCKECGKKSIIKKESEYVICSNCKSTILVEKDVVGNVPVEYSNLTPKEFYLLLSKEKSFNPYFFPDDSPYHLEPHFEKTLKDTRIGFSEIDNINPPMIILNEDTINHNSLLKSGEELLYKTVKENEKSIITKLKKKS